MSSTHQMIMYIVAILAFVHLVYSAYILSVNNQDTSILYFTIISIIVNIIIIALAAYCSTMNDM